MEVKEILCSFKLALEGKTGKEIPESSRLDFIEKFMPKVGKLGILGINVSMKSNLFFKCVH